MIVSNVVYYGSVCKVWVCTVCFLTVSNLCTRRCSFVYGLMGIWVSVLNLTSVLNKVIHYRLFSLVSLLIVSRNYLMVCCGPGSGVKLQDIWLKVLLYAVGLVLLAETPQELQAMMDKLSLFCQHNGMTVNIKKSECVVFNKRVLGDQRDVSISFNNENMVIKSKFVYLGMLFEDDEGIKNAQERVLTKGRGAMYALLRRCSELDIHNVALKCRLFDALVRPVLCYGCELWGPSILSRGATVVNSGFREKLECLHRDFLRQCLGVRKSVPDLVLMTEMRREPLIMCVVKQLLQFWNNIQARKNDDLVKLSLQESCGERVGWAKHLNTFLKRYGVSILDRGDQTQIDVNSVLNSVRAKWQSQLCAGYSPYVQCVDGQFQCETSVRSVHQEESVGFKTITYLRWFADTNSDLQNTFVYNLHRKVQIKNVACFRLGSHWLNVEMQRYMPNRVSRCQRLCPLCGEDGPIEDEMHILSCPLYERIFHNFGAWVGTYCFEDEDGGMNKCMNNYYDRGRPCVFWANLAKVLSQCKKRRELYVTTGE